MSLSDSGDGGRQETSVAIACQGGGSHTAFTTGVLQELLPNLPESHEIVGLSGASGGALYATTAWYGLLTEGPERARDLLGSLWDDLAASTVFERLANAWGQWLAQLQSAGMPMPSVSPYATPIPAGVQAELGATLERHVDFDAIPSALGPGTPRLLVSAIRVDDGDFVVFTGEEITADRVLASTAIPSLFPAVHVDGEPTGTASTRRTLRSRTS